MTTQLSIVAWFTQYMICDLKWFSVAEVMFTQGQKQQQFNKSHCIEESCFEELVTESDL